jgi:hypothetical protein
MKTRQELILDFMLALASNPIFFDEKKGRPDDWGNAITTAKEIRGVAGALADEYIEKIL